MNNSQCLQTLVGHDGGINSVAFSYDSTRLASGSNYGMVKIWDIRSGKCLQTINSSGLISSLAFFRNSAWRKNITGVIAMPEVVGFWNMEKAPAI